jgi:hypothetical protein
MFFRAIEAFISVVRITIGGSGFLYRVDPPLDKDF